MIAYLIVPEVLALGLGVLIRTVHAADLLPLLAAAVLIKALYYRKKPDSAVRQFQLPAALLLVELGTLISLYAGYNTSRKVWLTAVLLFAALLTSYQAVEWYRRHQPEIPLSLSISVLSGAAVIGCIVFRRYADADDQNGCYNWIYIGSISLQYSEPIKLAFAAAFAAALKAARKSPHAVLVFYAAQVLNTVLLGILKEYGTAMQLVFSTCILGLLVCRLPERRDSFKAHLVSSSLPLAALVGFSAGLRVARTALARARVSGIDMEKIVLGHSLHFWDLRLNSRGEEIVLARKFMQDAPLICPNLTHFTSFKQMHPALMNDYAFALTVGNFGVLIPAAAVLLLSVLLLRVIVCRRRAAADGDPVAAAALASAVLLLVQSAIHILSPFGILPFTGVNLPFVSKGYNSLIVTAMLLVTTELLPRAKAFRSETAVETVLAPDTTLQ